MSLRSRRVDSDKGNTASNKEKLRKRRKTEGWKEMDIPTPLSTPDRCENRVSLRGGDIHSGEVQSSDGLRSLLRSENGHQEEEVGVGAEEELISEDELLDSGYRILSVLGRGNFSTTYLAEDVSKDLDAPDSSRLVAIKRLKRPFGAIGENEYSLLRYLYSDGKRPRHIISPISCFFAESGHFHLVLERLDSGRPVALVGCFCQEAHSKLACPARHISLAKVVLQLLSGLLSLHSHNLIHADLTPANMLFLPSSNRIKLIDLGNTIRPEDREAYLDDFSVQSVCYRAPEILLGQGPLSRVMDVWSTGVVAVELLLDGEVVGEGLRGVELVRSHIEDREGMVRRVIELVGSVMDYQFGMYYLDAYDDVSLETVQFAPKKKRRKVAHRWYAARAVKPDDNPSQEDLRRPRKGILGPYLTGATGDPDMAGFLIDMMEVDVHKRKTVKEMMRHPWLVEKLLGDWGGVLMRTAEDDAGRSDEELDEGALEEVDEEEAEDLEVDEFDLGEETTLVNDEDAQVEREGSGEGLSLINGHENLLEEALTTTKDAMPESILQAQEGPTAVPLKNSGSPNPWSQPEFEPEAQTEGLESGPNTASPDLPNENSPPGARSPIVKQEAPSESADIMAGPALVLPLESSPIHKPRSQSLEPETPPEIRDLHESSSAPIKSEPDVLPFSFPSTLSPPSRRLTSPPSPTPPIPADLISGRTSDIWHRDLAADMDEVSEDDDGVMLL